MRQKEVKEFCERGFGRLARIRFPEGKSGARRGFSEPLPIRTVAFLTTLFLGILTLWAPAYWPAAGFLCGIFVLTVVQIARQKAPGKMGNDLQIALITILAALPVWGFAQQQLGLTLYRETTLTKLPELAAIPCVVYLASSIPTGFQRQARHAMLWFGSVLSVAAMLQSVAEPGRVFGVLGPVTNRFMMGPIPYHNHWAVFVEVVLPIALYDSLCQDRSKRWLYSLTAATLYASILVSASRAGFFIATAELLAGALLALRSKQQGWISATATLISSLALIALLAGPSALMKRLLDTDLTVDRASWNLSSFAMILDHPFHGVGLGNWPTAYPQYALFDTYRYVNQAHSDWLQWTAEGGVISLSVLAITLALSIRRAVQHPWALGVPAALCHAFVDYPFSRPAITAWIFALVGLSAVAHPKE